MLALSSFGSAMQGTESSEKHPARGSMDYLSGGGAGLAAAEPPAAHAAAPCLPTGLAGGAAERQPMEAVPHRKLLRLITKLTHHLQHVGGHHFGGGGVTLPYTGARNIRPVPCTLTHTHSQPHLDTHSFTHSFIHLLIHSQLLMYLTHSCPTRPVHYSLTHSQEPVPLVLNFALTHSLIHSLTHTYSFTHIVTPSLTSTHMHTHRSPRH